MACFWYLFLSLYSEGCISLTVKLWIVIYSGLTASHEKLRAVSFEAAESFQFLVRKDYTTWDFKCFVVFGAPDSLLLWHVGGSSVKLRSKMLCWDAQNHPGMWVRGSCWFSWHLGVRCSDSFSSCQYHSRKAGYWFFPVSADGGRLQRANHSPPPSTLLLLNTVSVKIDFCLTWLLAGEARGSFFYRQGLLFQFNIRDVPVLTSSFLPKLDREEYGHDFQISHKPGVPKRWE